MCRFKPNRKKSSASFLVPGDRLSLDAIRVPSSAFFLPFRSRLQPASFSVPLYRQDRFCIKPVFFIKFSQSKCNGLRCEIFIL